MDLPRSRKLFLKFWTDLQIHRLQIRVRPDQMPRAYPHDDVTELALMKMPRALPMKMPRTLPHEDATGLPRGTSRSLLTPDQPKKPRCHGLAPWSAHV